MSARKNTAMTLISIGKRLTEDRPTGILGDSSVMKIIVNPNAFDQFILYFLYDLLTIKYTKSFSQSLVLYIKNVAQ